MNTLYSSMNTLYSGYFRLSDVLLNRAKNNLFRIIILILILGSFELYAQDVPGGIAPAAWYRSDGSLYSDAGTTLAANNATVYQWNEALGTGRNLIQTSAGARPVFSNGTVLANFNPTVTFDGSNDILQHTPSGAGYIDRADGTIYSAGYVNVQKGNGFAGFHASMNYPGLHMYSANNKLLFFTSGGPGYQGLSMDMMPAKRHFIAGSGWQNGAGGSANHALATVSLNGIRGDITGSKIYNVNTAASYNEFRIGRDSDYGAFNGQLNEILIFENKLTVDEMDRVETYLAIKYGTTYANGTRDYKNAGGSPVWTAATNTGYINNIAGIANDGALQQKQSWSTNPGQQVLIGTTGLTGTNSGNGIALTAGQYLIWGDNGLAKVPTVATSAFPSVSHHFQAIWKVQNTGTVETVRVAWPKGLKSLSLIQSSDPTIGAGDILTPMTSQITINDVDYNYVDVTLTNGQYFTFAAKVPAPGGVTAGLTQWYRADEGLVKAGGDGTNVTTWTDVARGTVSGKIGTAPVPVFKEGSTNYFNFNPGVNFTAIQQMLGNITTQTLENTSFDIFTLTKEGMSGTRYFNIGRNNTSFSGANWDQPGLYVSGNVATRNSSGGGLGITNPGNIDFSTTIPSIMYHTFTNTSIRKGVNGAGLGTQYNVSARGQMTGGHIFGSNGGTNPPGGDDWGFKGHIGEVIIYGAGNLTATERNRVDSYLALKYGVTLPSGVNYLNSNGDIVWNSTTNSAYHNNVAGIVNDEASALNQKQSISVNKGQQVIISTTGLTDTNVGNLTSLSSDGQYLIWGDNGLAKTLSASFNFASVPSLNLRFAAIWKVQNTGTVGTVRVAWPSGIPSLTLIQSADATIDDSDMRTDMTANTLLVNGISYNYADVTLSDGQYFTFAGFVSGPGNVASAAWYRADGAGQQFSDAGTTVAEDGQTLQQWNEYKGTGYNLVQATSGDRPVFSNATKLANFNPTVTFSGRHWMRYDVTGTTNLIDRADGTIYASGYLNRLSNVDIAGFGETTLDYPGLHTHTTGGNTKTLFYAASHGGYPGVSDNNLVNKNYFTMGGAWQNGAGGDNNHLGATISQNGIRKYYTGTELNNVTQVANTASNIYRSFRIGEGNYGPLYGQLNEVVVFENRLTEDEMNRVDTYMAIKYGTTYAEGTKDYLNSASGVVWATGDNNGYHFNIAGIARDDMGSLYQKQSWSTNPGRQVLISTTGLDNTNAANSGVLTNGQFLIWGDNNLAKSPSVTIAGIPDVNYRFASIWKVQNTNSVGVVRVAWPKGYANLKLIQSLDATIDASDQITAMENSQVVNGIEYAYADVTLANGHYFTFAAFIQAPGGVTNNLSYWYRADKFATASGVGADVTSWTDFTSGTTVTELGDNALPILAEGSSTYFNYNPGINFTSTAQALGNLNVQTVSALNFDIYTLTKEGITAGGNGRIFSSLVNNTNVSGSIAYWDGIGIMADQRLERVNNAFGSRYLANPGGTWAATYPSITYNKFTDLSLGKGINGNASISNGTHSARGTMTGGHAFGSTQFSANSSDNAGFTGNIGELIIYGNGNNSAVERNKVESYLAIKYGITLANTNNYTTSQDVVVWNASDNAGYYNNVAGIGNDFNSALHQKQSRSQHPNTNNQVIIGLGEIAASNAANTDSLNDGQYLVWGDNGNTQAMTNTASTYTAFNFAGGTNNARRMNRVWKVQNTNATSEVQLRFPVSSVGTTTFAGGIEACAQYVLLTASDAAFTTNVTAMPLTVNGSDYDLLTSFPNGASYFTFAKVTPINSGEIYLPSVIETTTSYNDNCGAGEWKYYYKSDDNTQNLFAAAGFTGAELNSFTVTITPEGTSYNDGAQTTNLMPRITTVEDAGAFTTVANKVRVYYSASELSQTNVAGANASGWYKYEGNAEEVIVDIYGDGLMDPTKAISLTPDASGVENGVNYVEFHNITSFSSFIYVSTTEQSPLPVTLAQFNVNKHEKNVILTWKTTNEQNSKSFIIERSTDAKSWDVVGQVAASGESTSERPYDFTDVSPLSGVNYYRLKMIDQDDTYAYSRIRSVRMDGVAGVVLYPNPVSNRLLFKEVKAETVNRVLVYDNAGRAHIELNKLPSDGINVAGLSSGIYIVVLKMADGSVTRHKITVQK
ncbi:T9SS type A sorting domain-containing protein [Dyadobacter tibetensis]|uniref:T9SS type A sorting domain-containing protein n=1 Tax=Dyadobacter tibetensis TaxID=1211851 RepID=UPI0004AFCD4B|nr:T9SS type A sorting domain-containing protein [Dyadobacter tibetensis]